MGAEESLTHVSALRRYARLLTGDAHKADDLVQDTLERAVSRWAMWRPGAGLRPWLFTLMHNIHANQRRDNRHDDAALPLHEAPEPGHEPHQQLADRLDLAQALSRLPPDHRAVLLLVTVEEYSYAEAAALLDVPLGTVMSRLHRAREGLRRLMQTSGPPGTPGATDKPNLLLVKR